MPLDLGAFHPLLVHFPIALLIAALLFDAVGWLWRRPSFTEAALGVQVLGVLGALAAVLSGNQAEEAVEHLPGIHDVLELHESLGQAVFWAALAVLLLRGFLLWRGWRGPGVKALMVLLSLGLAILVGMAGYQGGRLVYDFGAGVEPVMRLYPSSERH